MEKQQKIRVLVAEDVEPIRNRYVHILTGDEEIEVVAAVASGKEAVEWRNRCARM